MSQARNPNDQESDTLRIMYEMMGNTDAPLSTPAFDLEQQLVFRNYPEVPTNLREIWHRSDTETKHTVTWKDLLYDTIAKLNTASRFLEGLIAKEDVMTLTARKGIIKTLTAANNALEEVEENIGYLYPFPPIHNNSKPSVESDNEDNTYPRILLNTDDNILLWIIRLPHAEKGYNSHLLSEFKELLKANTFPHISRWHCDFIHVFNHDSTHGMYDADNYHYKPFIDALVKTFSSYDSGDHFSYSAYNYFTELLPKGCYLHITKRSEKVGFFRDFEDFVLANLSDK